MTSERRERTFFTTAISGFICLMHTTI